MQIKTNYQEYPQIYPDINQKNTTSCPWDSGGRLAGLSDFSLKPNQFATRNLAKVNS
jgi:hypothetical protein